MTDQTSQDAVLTAARELFTRKGFANTSVSEICTQAGVSPPTLYYHFGNKDGLFEAVVGETLRLDDFCDRLGEAMAAHEDPWDQLRAYVRTYLTSFPDDWLNPGLYLQASTELTTTSLRQVASGVTRAHQLTKDLLTAGIASGQFRALDVDLVATCLLGVIDSFVRARVYLGAAYDLDEVQRCVVDLLSYGIGA